MSAEELPDQIRLLVDSLRKQNTANLSLTDVASVTEVLMGTMQVFFANIDTSVYRECRALSDYISNARKEIASLQPSDLESARIPRAGLELDAIVQSTEDATNTIMEAAEEIMGADTSDSEAYQAVTQDAVMRIFEACSFQDITGQRISKVVETLSYIEKRVLELRNLLGVTEDDIDVANEEHQKELDERALLSGPALEGEGIDQNLVDQLLGDDDAAPAAEAPAPEPTPEPVAEAAPPPPPKPQAPPPPPAPEPPKPVNPRQLDSMFEEDFDPVAELAAKEAEKEEAKKKAEEEEAKKAAAKKEEKKEEDIDLPSGEEVSQDDIDALFG
ncbi:protein phosphatase CheZ [Kordiimonas sp. SCSIO 12603]|uniref:protein phosphatase CheZ n=1 Tax=Kordiimonas sp. SCSIO 12603 TaxID=2829596 RepID=UPI002102AF6F|nr:protein phosphatase CheZ [Kordiimonas sp. SCSIO 12603]UTW58436.1 protein phosphatase CheZ [Kordiimonas sp. SCSIO 12603]